MKNNMIASAMLVLAVIFTSCKDDDGVPAPRGTIEEYVVANDVSEFTQKDSGIYFRLDTDVEGDLLAGDDVVRFYTSIYSMEDDLLYDGFTNSDEWITSLDSLSIVVSGMKEALQMMSLGDVATVLIPNELAYGGYGVLDGKKYVINPYEDIKVVIKPVKVEMTVQEYVDSLGIQDYQTGDDGLIYTIEDGEGTGDLPVNGQTMSVHYTGMTFERDTFDTSLDNNVPLTFTVGAGYYIKGWESGLMHFKKGQKGTLYLPYYLAYGNQSNGSLAPYENLIFDIEVIDIK
ncbi:FKBP-type peptidyl-prolyl cis-trans isomerase [Reichenbachiella agarivorans]|uniref:Peptidyl-prolyl cis-trans isomerase n=1 Tax=Reichenbachiella agarivorans TaxID=2979464 RepID=A0ABY6CTU1_9BACT|nr:FKBP-type peptidyl-prolyl cis-trans isomerase [Reichenbachiella agarivorans]UXP33918.1 FKBP-type peptidyl-prolyl cis-trans isomerase [Reichenbachiella agarivorans]